MFFSATIHSPAASIYANYSTATRSERSLAPAFIAGGAIAALMPVLAGLIGILTVARYGTDSGLAGYRNLTTLAAEISPVMGGIALAAVLAAVISSGGPILLSSATMFVRDWIPSASTYSSARRLRAYRTVTVGYALISALIAWWIATSTRVSILDLLLFAFAMVVPAAISVAFVLYWRRTTEPGAYWGMLAGYGAGGFWFVLIKWALWIDLQAPEGASAPVRLLVSLLTSHGEGLDPAYVTTMVPLLVVPAVSLFTALSPEREIRSSGRDSRGRRTRLPTTRPRPSVDRGSSYTICRQPLGRSSRSAPTCSPRLSNACASPRSNDLSRLKPASRWMALTSSSPRSRCSLGSRRPTRRPLWRMGQHVER